MKQATAEARAFEGTARGGRPASGMFRVGSLDRAGRFPRSREELGEWFPDEIVCHEYLAYLRWRNGFVCDQCTSTAAPRTADRGLLSCSECGALCSATSGTPFSGLSLTRAFHALWDVFARESGANPRVLAEQLRTSPGLAWRFLEAMRAALVRHDEDRLYGHVHVGQLPVTVEEADGTGRLVASRAQVIVAAEIKGEEVTRVRFAAVQGCAPDMRADFVRRAVAAGSTIRTVRSPIFDELVTLGYRHVAIGGAGEQPTGVQRVASLLALWLYGSDGVSVARLGYFLDELAFRYNHRFAAGDDDKHGYLFFTLLRRALLVGEPAAELDDGLLPAARAS
jgi:hypothetical protein